MKTEETEENKYVGANLKSLIWGLRGSYCNPYLIRDIKAILATMLNYDYHVQITNNLILEWSIIEMLLQVGGALLWHIWRSFEQSYGVGDWFMEMVEYHMVYGICVQAIYEVHTPSMIRNSPLIRERQKLYGIISGYILARDCNNITMKTEKEKKFILSTGNRSLYPVAMNLKTTGFIMSTYNRVGYFIAGDKAR